MVIVGLIVPGRKTGSPDDVKSKYKKCYEHFVLSKALLVRGLVEKKDGVINVIGHQFYPLTFASEEIRIRSRDFQ